MEYTERLFNELNRVEWQKLSDFIDCIIEVIVKTLQSVKRLFMYRGKAK